MKYKIQIPISSEAERQNAIVILKRYNEPIGSIDYIDGCPSVNYLQLNYNVWVTMSKHYMKTDTTLSQLESILIDENIDKKTSTINWLLSFLKTDEDKEKAKFIHRQEIEEAYNDGTLNETSNEYLSAENYYNNTFKID